MKWEKLLKVDELHVCVVGLMEGGFHQMQGCVGVGVGAPLNISFFHAWLNKKNGLHFSCGFDARNPLEMETNLNPSAPAALFQNPQTRETTFSLGPQPDKKPAAYGFWEKTKEWIYWTNLTR